MIFHSTLLRSVVKSSHFLISTHFSVIFPKHWPRSFFLSITSNFQFFFHLSPREFKGFLSIDSPVFLYHLPIEFWRFFIYNYIYLYTCWSSRTRTEAIVISWSRGLVIWHDTTSSKHLQSHDLSSHHPQTYKPTILNLALITYATKTANCHFTIKDLSSGLTKPLLSQVMVVD